MAKSATSNRPTFKPRRNKTVEDRNKGRGQFLTLKKTGETFLGYAMFVADPERDDNPGYYEYMEHYTPSDGYVPCMESDDADCPICEEGDSPSTRAKSVFLIVDEEDDDPSEGTLKIFNLNWYVLQEFADDGETAYGQLYRVRKKEGQGQLSVRPKAGSKLTKTQMKAALKDIPDLEKITSAQVFKYLQEIGAAEALSEEEQDEDEEPKSKASGSKAKKGKKVEEPDEKSEDDAFDPDDADEFEGTVTVKKVNKKNDILTVTTEDDVEFDVYGTDKISLADTYSKGDEVMLHADKDDDGDFVVSSVEGEEQEGEEEKEGEAEVADSLDEVEATIVSIDTEKETMTVEEDDGDQHEIFFLDDGADDEDNDWSEFNLDDYEEGDKVTVSAAKDDDGDLLASVFPAKAKKAGGKKKGSKK